MKLVNFELDGKKYSGALTSGGNLLNIPKAARALSLHDVGEIESVEDILSNGLSDNVKRIVNHYMKRKSSPLQSGPNAPHISAEKTVIIRKRRRDTNILRLDEVRLLPPIQKPGKILLAAINYATHGKEQQNITLPKEPYLFSKFPSCVIGPGEPIIVPKSSTKVDYEIEFAVVIGRKGKYIPKNDAMEYVGGYTILNDISFRDFQLTNSSSKNLDSLGYNWVMGKALDASCPIGPCLAMKDEVKDPYSLTMELRVNGEVRQREKTGEMIFKIEDFIEYISNGITLEPGDIISTGTPAGVAVFSGKPFLKDGDIVEAEIEGIGVLRNPVKSEANVTSTS
jgi:2-keto-4-pentenoate hydratase/2-oxohepta-3-ene-1,7-dioic acid hydratase in catechol pathway